MGGFSPWHLLVIALVALVLFFGWKQLPDMARSLGRSLRVFKTEIKGMSDDDKARDAGKDEPKQLEAKQVEAKPSPPPAPRAQVVRNAVPEARAAAPQPVRTRPRPAPSPNGRASAN